MDETTASTETLREWLNAAKRILAFCGAGVSAESGLPTFRDAGGLWEGHAVEDVATPEGFAADPLLVWRFYAARQRALLPAEPNPAHRALAAIEHESHLDDFLLVSQNVDDLHERAGSRRLVKLHGNLMETRCTGCGRLERLTTAVPDPDRHGLPQCHCGAMLRPNVVWFGEWLDPLVFQPILRFFESASGPSQRRRNQDRGETLVLLMGTSGLVGGGYNIPDIARSIHARIVEINPSETYLTPHSHLAVRAPASILARAIESWAPRIST